MKGVTIIGADHLVSVNDILGEKHLEVLPPDGFVEGLGVEPGDNVALEMSHTYRKFAPYDDMDDRLKHDTLLSLRGYGLFKDLRNILMKKERSFTI